VSKRIAVFLFISLFSVLALAPRHAAANGLSVIRDAEIENTIRAFASPVLTAAGLDQDAVNIYIVKDNSLNAFVAGGQNLFIHTGLIMQSGNASQVIGVLAHETGHIAGGHLTRMHDAIAKSSRSAILGFILGGAAAIATGRGDVGAAIAAGGQSMAMRNFLSYSRGEEGSADQAALKLLDATKQSARGMLEFLKVLEGQELLSSANQDPYVRTHPLSAVRIRTIEHHVANSPYSDVPTPENYVRMHERIKAKLHGFVNPVGRTLRLYKASDKSVPARYARAIAHHRKARFDKALALMDGLIAEHPNDPYFHELKGQILFESGRVRDSIAHHRKAADLLPTSPVILYQLAKAELETNDPALIDPAIINLEAAVAKEPRTAMLWRQLSIGYGRKGDIGRSSLALAEEALIQGNADVAQFHAGKAERYFPEGSREWIQAQDISLAANGMAKARKKKKGK